MSGNQIGNNVEAVFFDIGNTLLYANPQVPDVFVQEAKRIGITVDVVKARKFMCHLDEWYDSQYAEDGDFWCCPVRTKNVWMTMYRMMGELMNVGEHASRIAEGMYRAYISATCWSMYSDVMPCLQSLRKRGIQVGVISNWGDNLDDLLTSLGLRSYFDVVVASASVGYRKPNPAIFELACKRMGVRAESCIHVGDLPDADGDGAAAAGIKPVLLDRNNRLGELTYDKVTCLDDLLSYL